MLTHPYEGGHPDHDATAFAVHAACRLLRRAGRTPPALIEMASYFLGPEGYCLHQRFAPEPGLPELVVRLGERRRAQKRGMFAAHASQAGSLWIFTDEEERFRPAPRYDFTALPNGGLVNYERFGWGMTGQTWTRLAADALRALEAEPGKIEKAVCAGERRRVRHSAGFGRRAGRAVQAGRWQAASRPKAPRSRSAVASAG